jgi:hypothetical protein
VEIARESAGFSRQLCLESVASPCKRFRRAAAVEVNRFCVTRRLADIMNCLVTHRGHNVAMANLNLTLPDWLQQFAEAQARANGVGGAAEYVVSLLAREQRKRADLDQIEAALKQGLDSGAMIELNDHFWERKRHELLARHRAREAQGGQSSSNSAAAGGKP